ncbi:TetR/AcrR family transcriptional regulator [Rhizobium sp. CG5]|uniref:TetR/AcrR family transcriptional regulator n=1 Tax=Rhizobium sp. CG5 TaxID=2726076 RepID=UPI002033FE45|nr:TetR/AcrR family transcriptional regulator [Rhizobium sp. CG5]MCM2473245.1 TetR/AcrR family transcriptional regulator [Rhizobium sp. CG5]
MDLETARQGKESVSIRPPVMPEAERRMLIIEAAERVFSATGYGDATMEQIARDCGMAKKSVYRLYPDKQALFTALINSHEYPAITRPTDPATATVGRQALHDLLLDIARFVFSPRQLRLTRLVISEAGKSPELAQQFYDDCVQKTRSFVSQEIERNSAVTMKSHDPGMIADVFIGATLGALQFKALISKLDCNGINDELETRIDIALALILGPAPEQPTIVARAMHQRSA